jgi:hypothetical protein
VVGLLQQAFSVFLFCFVSFSFALLSYGFVGIFLFPQRVRVFWTHLKAENCGGNTRCINCKERACRGEYHKKHMTVCIHSRYISVIAIGSSLAILITSMQELLDTNAKTGM